MELGQASKRVLVTDGSRGIRANIEFPDGCHEQRVLRHDGVREG